MLEKNIRRASVISLNFNIVFPFKASYASTWFRVDAKELSGLDRDYVSEKTASARSHDTQQVASVLLTQAIGRA